MTGKERVKELHRDESGAMMVLALFMALFLVGAMFYILGIGDAVLHRRVMQDGVDAGAFSAAVMGARGMNLVALLNILMAVAVMILLAWKLMELALTAAIFALGVAAAIPFVGAVPGSMIGPTTTARNAIANSYPTVEQIAKNAHKAIDEAFEPIQVAWPILAEVRAVDVMAFQNAYDPPVTAGFVYPPFGPKLPSSAANPFGLPIEEHDDIEPTCDIAGRYVVDFVAGAPFAFLPGWLRNRVTGVVKKPVEAGLKVVKYAVCGVGDDSATIEVEKTTVYPRVDGEEACSSGCRGTTHHTCAGACSTPDSTACGDAVRDLCDYVQEIKGARVPADEAGCSGDRYICETSTTSAFECDPDQRESGGDGWRRVSVAEYERETGLSNVVAECQANVSAAMSACDPGSLTNPDGYAYLRTKSKRVYYQRTNPVTGNCEMEFYDASDLSDREFKYSEEEDPPCGAGDWRAGATDPTHPWPSACNYDIVPPYILSGPAGFPRVDFDHSSPAVPGDSNYAAVCSTLPTEAAARANDAGSNWYVFERSIVPEVYTCMEKTTEELDKDELLDNSLGPADLKVARRVIDEDDAGEKSYLGDEWFQYRGFAVGNHPNDGRWASGERGVRVARGGQATAGGLARGAAVVGRVSYAQAEYFFGEKEDRENFLWKMSWKARLVRFRPPTGDLMTRIETACGDTNSDSRFGRITGAISDVCEAVPKFVAGFLSFH